MTLHALVHRFAIKELVVPYGVRPEGSVSKLRTIRDGRRVLWTIAALFRHYRPMALFGSIGLLLLVLSVIGGVLVVGEFVKCGQVTGVARAVLAVACGILGVPALVTGIVLDTVSRRAREMYVLIADQVVDRASK